MRRAFAILAMTAGFAAHALVSACGGDVVLGDDGASEPAARDSGAVDATRSDGEPSASDAGAVDAAKGTCASEGGACTPQGGSCTKVDSTGLTCAVAGEICCLVSCPELQQPPPGFCDGGPIAQTFAANGCVNGFACAPVACAAAGGGCVGLAPGNCPSNHIGDANRYSCGGGLGTMCCLP